MLQGVTIHCDQASMLVLSLRRLEAQQAVAVAWIIAHNGTHTPLPLLLFAPLPQHGVFLVKAFCGSRRSIMHAPLGISRAYVVGGCCLQPQYTMPSVQWVLYSTHMPCDDHSIGANGASLCGRLPVPYCIHRCMPSHVTGEHLQV